MVEFAQAFTDPVLRALPKIPHAILTLLVGIILIHFFLWLLERILRVARTPRTLHDILSSIVQVLLWVILIAAIFQSLGLTQVALTLSGTLAIAGVAIGAGANAMVQDIIAGLFLARDRDFDVGYTIKVGDVEGVIRHIDIRKVRVEDSKGKVHVLPTSNFDKSSWVVLKRG